jgi:hypothetical protein
MGCCCGSYTGGEVSGRPEYWKLNASLSGQYLKSKSTFNIKNGTKNEEPSNGFCSNLKNGSKSRGRSIECQLSLIITILLFIIAELSMPMFNLSKNNIPI